MFKKILIANRGEIACRIIRTARRMGIGTVAVFSDADREALHVEMADEAIRIGPPPAAQSYAAIGPLLDACKVTGTEAVHPGYGFLSEQAAFAQALIENGIAFIGPHPAAIEWMGDKIAAKKLAHSLGVASLPGFLDAIESLEEAQTVAQAVGYPVMIKASAGGGGRGLRIVEKPEDMPESFSGASSEASTAFGNGHVFLEKFIKNARHIEIQILGDKYGNLIHLGERECSIQRRHQKIIEEAPSSFVDAGIWRSMGEQAIALGRAAKYDSVGTVEFLMAPDGRFYFLEMNTRLQVEHPVTEFVTGIDIVEEMIRVAAGETLSIVQDDVHPEGFALECRILAEDPARNFLPSSGRLNLFRPPAEGREDDRTVRIDCGAREGDEISLHYDSLIAKVITHAPDRGQAIAAQRHALDRFVIEGVAHNLSFLDAVLGEEAFRAGKISTDWIAEKFPRSFAPPAPQGEAAEQLIAVAAFADHVLEERRRQISGRMVDADRRPLAFERMACIDEDRHEIEFEATQIGFAIRFLASGRNLICVSDWTPGKKVWQGRVDGVERAVKITPVLNDYLLSHGGFEAKVSILTRREVDLLVFLPKRKNGGGSSMLRCPMPALVKAVLVAEGQAVRAGEPLCIIEAMKMETALRAEADGTIAKIHVQSGDILAVDAVILDLV
ncbi:MAG TPA: acetyl/propionyl/methylcrotonyl-CoA carboxylase subunit alpha [Methylocella sp.]|nr:acetyl/propionyl/methylcrotonyl-CoA carboxylase subunit alpha [Methylocella sp.]